MNKKDSDLLDKLLPMFKEEAKERVDLMTSSFIELERTLNAEKQSEIIEKVFREAHSLKGAARSVNIIDIEIFCQSLESLFASLKRKTVVLSPDLFDILHKAASILSQLILSAGSGKVFMEKSQITEIIKGIENASMGMLPEHKREQSKEAGDEDSSLPAPEVSPRAVEEKPLSTETIRMSTAKLDSLLLKAEELLFAKLAARQHTVELEDTSRKFDLWKNEWRKIYPEVRKSRLLLEKEDKGNRKKFSISSFTKLTEFLDWNYNYIKSIESQLGTFVTTANQNLHTLERMVDDLLEEAKRAVMFPFSSVLTVFPGFVRELSREQHKDVDLETHGEEVEIDKRILEEIKDVLLHLIRNSIDHGIEELSVREQKKKPHRGLITIEVSPKNGSNVEILISDDGAGIDIAKVKRAAVKAGIASGEEVEKMTEQEALMLVFQSGISTSPIITDLSGRGLGLAIVREKVEKLGGVISFKSQPGVGAECRIVIPITLAIFRGIIVRVGERLFVLPTLYVEQVKSFKKEDVKTVENRETLQLNGRVVSLIRLEDVLEIPTKKPEDDSGDKITVMMVRSAEKRLALQVDVIHGEQEVLVKKLGKQMPRVRNCAGATVLGNGMLVPILNVPDLIKSVGKTAGVRKERFIDKGEIREKRKSILIVEDSITARTLLKNILESAGYDVKTAIDGIDAWTTLKTGEFDIVVSDVDMPRMNGFNLTEKIRSDEKLSELPVVLVTALESRSDRERGIDVGANAYIIKSSFEQSNLLEAIQKLI